MVLMVDITVPMVRDRARPVSMAPSPPTTMAYATAMMEPDRQSDGTEPPTAEMPMKIASSEAPMMMPVWKSPKSRPTSGATTMGRFRHCQDRVYGSSQLMTAYTTAQMIAAVIDIAIFPPCTFFYFQAEHHAQPSTLESSCGTSSGMVCTLQGIPVAMTCRRISTSSS